MLLMPVLMPKGTSTEIESLVDMGFLMVFISPIAWRLRQTSHHLFEAKLVVEKNLQTQNAINQLLSLQSDLLSKDDLFNQALAVFFTIEWLKVQHKGAIFLNNPNAESLTMVAHTGLSEFLIRDCAEVVHAYCLCGTVACDWDLKNSNHVDCTHTKHYAEMDDHGHYIVPLISEKKLKGVLCLYLQAGHEYDANEVDTLKVLGATLAELIRAKQSMIQLGLADTVFMHSLTCLMVADAENRILSINPAFTTVTGYTLEDVKGKHPTMLSSGLQKDDFYAAMWQKLTETGYWQGEVWDKRKNGEHYLEWLSIAEVRDHKDQVQNYIAAFADITHQKEAEKRIMELAYYDNLTGLANRTLFYDRFKQSIIHAKRHNTQLALLFIDLDRFKDVNDALGHATGDSFLKIVASRIGHCLRESDVLARLGGDEFVVLLKDLDDAAYSVMESCQKVAENILRELSQSYHFGQYTFYGGCSVGIAIYPDHGDNVDDLIQKADTAMYEAKVAGRNTYRFFSTEQSLALASKLNMNHALRQALNNNEFSLVYQPLVNMNDRSIIGAEVLLRWQNPEFGSISPVVFIPLAEEMGLIVTIGEWVFEQACRQIYQWQAKNWFIRQHLAVNVSIHQLLHPGFADRLYAICRQFDISPTNLELEITEGGLAHQPDSITNTLSQLQEFGFSLAIDDFGTDYSSLGRLKSFHVDLLKIDRSFVRDMTFDLDDAALAKAIIELAKALSLITLAEGIETEEQYQLLKEYQCARGQGYLFGKPMPVHEFEKQCKWEIASSPPHAEHNPGLKYNALS